MRLRGEAPPPCLPPTPAAALPSLPRGCFDVVCLCLVLSYIPQPLQRTEAVWRARQLLREGGLLLIITPHSTNRRATPFQA